MKRLIIVLCIFAFICSCQKSTDPLVSVNDPRNYTWTVDTLYFPNSIQTMMSEIWASSSKDVYVIGHCDNSSGHLFHFDGVSWINIGLGGSDGGPIHAPFNINDINGLSENDIYIVGNKRPSGDRQSLIVHYNGTEWEEIVVPAMGELTSVWGSSPDDIWAGGNHGTLFHYNGTEWKVKDLPHSGYSDLEVSLNVKEIYGYSSDHIYFYSYSVFPYGRILYHTFSYENRIIALQDSVWGNSTNELWQSPEGNMYKATTSGIYKEDNKNWEKISDNKTYAIHGTCDKNIFAVCQSMDGFILLHFNGIDWYVFEELQREDVFYRDVFTIDNEVFVVGYTSGAWPSKTIVWHGK